MGTSNRVQTLEEVVCISHSARNHSNDMNPTILHPAMAK